MYACMYSCLLPTRIFQNYSKFTKLRVYTCNITLDAVQCRPIIERNLTTVKSVYTGTPWGQNFVPVWTGSGLDRVFAFGE